jgi:hypothetical protein
MRRVDAQVHSLPQALRRILECREAVRRNLHFGVTGLSVARSRAVDSEVVPLRSALVALLPVALSCLVLSQAVSCRLRPSSTSR